MRWTLSVPIILLFAGTAAGQASSNSQGVEGVRGDDPLKIVQTFAAKEKEFKQAYEHYSYTRDVTVRAKCPDGISGDYHLIVDVTLDPKGDRLETVKVVNNSIQCITITKEDLESFRNQSLLVLTTDEIQDYRFSFIGQQQDDSHSYVFDVSPVAVQPNKPQFKGRIWVDSRELVIVKSYGTIVMKGQRKQKGPENLLPAVATTGREQIDGRYWFPTYIRSSDVLHFSPGVVVQIDELVKITNYKAR